MSVMPGELVSQNAAAFILASREREVDFAVPPADAAALPLGAPVDFALNGTSYSLKVSQSSEVPIPGVVPLVAAVPAGLPLPFGSIGTVSYSLSLARGSLIPTGALQTNEDKNFVFVVEGGKALVRQITILAESGNSAAVSGVNARQHGRSEPAAGSSRRLDSQADGAGYGGRQQMNTTRELQAKIFDRINPAVRFSVTRYVFAIGVFVAIFVFGLISLFNLGVDQFPSVNFPYVVVTTAYPGASPSVIDQQVTQVIENAVSTLSGIKDINSTSSTGTSQVTLTFDLSTDQASDANQVASLVSAAARSLPQGVNAPIVQTFDISAAPILQFGLSGAGTSLEEVNKYVTDELTPLLVRVPGVANVQTDGGPSRQFQVLLDPDRLQSFNLTPQQVVSSIIGSAVNQPIGTINSHNNALTFATENVPADTTKVANTLVDPTRGIRVSDIAVVRDFPVSTNYARVNGKPVVLVSIQKTSPRTRSPSSGSPRTPRQDEDPRGLSGRLQQRHDGTRSGHPSNRRTGKSSSPPSRSR